MKNNKHIQSFNEHQENLNISDVMNSKNQYNKVFEDEEALGDIYSRKAYEQVIKYLEEARNSIDDILDILDYEKYSEMAYRARKVGTKAQDLKYNIEFQLMGKHRSF
jgi:hypothetical protein